jgi:hypothetical protein
MALLLPAGVLLALLSPPLLAKELGENKGKDIREVTCCTSIIIRLVLICFSHLSHNVEAYFNAVDHCMTFLTFNCIHEGELFNGS